jgi:hypothetical protein
VVSHVPSQVVCWLQFFVASQVLGVNLLREDTVRKKYPESYTDCGTEEDEQCPTGYPGAQPGSEEYNEVMKFTSAVHMFGKSARKMIAKSRDKKEDDDKRENDDKENAFKCPLGNYAQFTAPKPGREDYKCKGDPACMLRPLYTPHPIVTATLARVPIVSFKRVPRGLRE